MQIEELSNLEWGSYSTLFSALGGYPWETLEQQEGWEVWIDACSSVDERQRPSLATHSPVDRLATCTPQAEQAYKHQPTVPEPIKYRQEQETAPLSPSNKGHQQKSPKWSRKHHIQYQHQNKIKKSISKHL